MVSDLYLQRDQPPGVPPLALTGERTLPDVPAENYWYRRHLVVYEWIATRTEGMRVIDMASGEGYGADLIAERASDVVAVEANPEAFEHSRLRYMRPNLRFERALVETYGDPESVDAVCFLQTIEHVAEPTAVLEHFRTLLSPGGTAYVSTPNLLTLAPAGASKSENPWHLREYRAHEFRELCASVFESVELFGIYHAGKLLWHQRALSLGWDRVHSATGLTKLFYNRFTPAISTADFALRDDQPLYRALDFVAVCR